MSDPRFARDWLSAMADRPHGLIDTGAILALLDEKDRWHSVCTAAFQYLPLPLATSVAVLTELFHLVRKPRDAANAWGFLRSGAVTVLPITESDLLDLESLMYRYRDRPMDFADATLVHLANRESLSLVFTVDHADFQTYRMGGKKPFRIVPEARP